MSKSLTGGTMFFVSESKAIELLEAFMNLRAKDMGGKISILTFFMNNGEEYSGDPIALLFAGSASHAALLYVRRKVSADEDPNSEEAWEQHYLLRASDISSVRFDTDPGRLDDLIANAMETG